MKIVLFYSYKGGVGRSATLCNMAAAFCKSGSNVGIVDLDTDASSLHLYMRSVIPQDSIPIEYKTDILTLLRCDYDQLTPALVKDATINFKLPKDYGHGSLIPCFSRSRDLNDLDDKWKTLQRNLNLILEMFTDNEELDYIFIDARSGNNIQTILGAMLADDVVALTRGDYISVSGMKMMLDLFNHKPIENIHLIITGVPEAHIGDDRIKKFLEEINYSGPVVIIPYIQAWYFGAEVSWTSNNPILDEAYHVLESEIKGNDYEK